MVEIPWIGYRSEMQWHLRHLNENGLEVLPIEAAKHALDILRERQYSGLIMQDWFQELGGLDVSRLRLGGLLDLTRISRYFLGEVRGLQGYGKTPIVVVHTLASEEAIRLKLDRNVNLLHLEDYSDLCKFSRDVKDRLRIRD